MLLGEQKKFPAKLDFFFFSSGLLLTRARKFKIELPKLGRLE